MSKPKSTTTTRELVFTLEYIVEAENAGLESVNLESVMDKLRETGAAKVVNVKIRKKVVA